MDIGNTEIESFDAYEASFHCANFFRELADADAALRRVGGFRDRFEAVIVECVNEGTAGFALVAGRKDYHAEDPVKIINFYKGVLYSRGGSEPPTEEDLAEQKEIKFRIGATHAAQFMSNGLAMASATGRDPEKYLNELCQVLMDWREERAGGIMDNPWQWGWDVVDQYIEDHRDGW